jgi:type I restriction enzyme M protein
VSANPPHGAHGRAGFVLANGSMMSNQSGEGEICNAVIEAEPVIENIAAPGRIGNQR